MSSVFKSTKKSSNDAVCFFCRRSNSDYRPAVPILPAAFIRQTMDRGEVFEALDDKRNLRGVIRLPDDDIVKMAEERNDRRLRTLNDILRSIAYVKSPFNSRAATTHATEFMYKLGNHLDCLASVVCVKTARRYRYMLILNYDARHHN